MYGDLDMRRSFFLCTLLFLPAVALYGFVQLLMLRIVGSNH